MSNSDQTHGSSLTKISLFLPPKAVCLQTLQELNTIPEQPPPLKLFVKNYMSAKIGEADSGIITIY